MDFLKKMLRDKQSKKNISFFSTDNNVLCENGKYLRNNLNEINNNFNTVNNNFNNINSQLSTLNGRFTLGDWKLLQSGTLPADTTSIIISQDVDGNSFSNNEFIMFFKVPKLDAKTTFKIMNNKNVIFSQDNFFGDETREKYIKYHIKFEVMSIATMKYSANSSAIQLNVAFGGDYVTNVSMPNTLNFDKVESLKILFGRTIENLEFWIYGR